MEKQQRDREIRMDIALFLMFFATLTMFSFLPDHGLSDDFGHFGAGLALSYIL